VCRCVVSEKLKGALGAYSHALTISADDPTILGNLASLYRSLGKEKEAETALRAIKVGMAPSTR